MPRPLRRRNHRRLVRAAFFFLAGSDQRDRAADSEIRASSLQFVRKLSGANKPSKANEELFQRAVEEVTAAAAYWEFARTREQEPVVRVAA